MAWHRAAVKGRLEALDTLWSCAKKTELNTAELLLSENYKGFTALHIAAGENNVEMLKQFWVWAEEEQLKRNDVMKKLLLAKNKQGHTVWQYAAGGGK